MCLEDNNFDARTFLFLFCFACQLSSSTPAWKGGGAKGHNIMCIIYLIIIMYCFNAFGNYGHVGGPRTVPLPHNVNVPNILKKCIPEFTQRPQGPASNEVW